MSLPDGEPQGVIELINELRHNGFKISTEQYIAAMKVAVLFTLNDDLKDHPDKLGTFLGPILCSTPEQQANFPQYFERWLISNAKTFGPEKPLPNPPSPVPSPTPSPVKQKKARWTFRSTYPAVLFGVLCLAIIGVSFYLQRPTERTLTLKISNAYEKPVTVRFVGLNVVSATTLFESATPRTVYCTYDISSLPAELTIEMPGAPTFRKIIDRPVESISVDLKSYTSESGQPIPVPSENRTWLLKNLGWISLGLVLGTVLLFLLLWPLWGALKARRKLELRKERSKQPLKTQSLSVKGAGEQLTQLLSLRRTAQELRRHRLFESTELDVNRTINETLRHGLFTPSYTSHKASPEYLILIDRANLDDQRARLATEIMDRLIRNGVFVTTYYFQGDPRLCRPDGLNAGNWTLPDLAARHPDHALMIFGEGTELFDPMSGSPHRWIDLFSPWSKRFLLSSDIRHGDYREWALRQAGIDVVPADGKGMRALSEIIHAGTQRAGSVPAPVKPLPELLRTRQDRWTEEHPPSAEVLKELCLQLRDFLGDESIYWLSACAVYPKLYWDLTLYLGYKLIDSEGFDQKFSTLLRLPWFRHGSMPDWLREPLVASLPTQKEQAVRNALEEMLLSSLANPDGFLLPIASRAKESEDKTSNQAFRKRLRNPWRRRRLIMEQLYREAGEAPMRDYVLVDFLNGRKPNKLATAVPVEIGELLYPRKPEIASQPAPASDPKREVKRSPVAFSKTRWPVKLRLLAAGLIVILLILLLIQYVGSSAPAGAEVVITVVMFVFGGILLFLFSFIRLPQVQDDDEPQMSALEKITRVFYTPTRIFRNLRSYPEWLAALIVIVVCSGVYREAFVQRLTPERITEHRLQSMVEGQVISADGAEAQRENNLRVLKDPILRLQSFLRSFVSFLTFYSFLAAVHCLGIMAFRGRINFWQALSAIVYSSVPAVIISTSLSLMILYIKAPDDIHPVRDQNTLVKDNLGILFSPESYPVLYTIGTYIGVLSFYALWLRVKGLRNAGYNVSSTAAWGASILVWLLGLILAAVFAWLFPTFLS